MAAPSLATGLQRLVPVLVAAVLVLPSVVWVAIDRSIWPWDPSWYGEVSIDLWATLRTDPGAWPGAMMHAFGQKPPAVAWLGQLFVPLGEVFGRDQTALLLSTVLCQAAVVAFVYAASLRLASVATAMVAALLVAASPLFVFVSHGYWAESIQTVAVAWLVLILAGAAERRPALTLAQLPGALALAMLAKVSSPAYVAAPAAGVLLLVWLYRARPAAARPAWRELAVVASSIISAFLVVGALRWYSINVDTAIQQARTSSADDGLYGVDRGLVRQLPEWIAWLRDASFLPKFWLPLCILAVVSIGLAWLRGARVALRDPRVVTATTCVVSILLVLAALASQPNDDTRFLHPLVPLVAVTLALAIGAARSRPILVVAVGVLVLEYAGSTLQSFGYTPHDSFVADRIRSPVRDTRFAEVLDEVVERTCTAESSSRISVVGGEYPWLNANTLEMLAFSRYAENGRRCLYTSLGYGQVDAAAAWDRVGDFRAPFFISVDYGNPANPLPEAQAAAVAQFAWFNPVSRAVFDRVAQSPEYKPVPGSREAGLVVFRRIDEG